ncbi:MAG: acyl carrier protein [Deltaproteobacteria bacterium]|nr:acyl carrier protein [Deltaproteobacteria bacterium]
MMIREKLKKMIVEEMRVEDVTTDDIEDDAPLFGEGLGLDSLDAVELVVLVKIRFGVEIRSVEEGRAAFQSINTLAAFIEERQTP